MLTKPKVHVYSDSVSCLGKIIQEQTKNSMLNSKNFNSSILTKNYFGIDGESIEFEWNTFPGLTSLEIFQMIQKDLQDQNMEPEHFEGRIIFRSMFTDIEERKFRQVYFEFRTSQEVRKKKSREDIGHS